jgi:hypothetical protein
MFEREEIAQEVWGEPNTLHENLLGGVVGVDGLIDPLMDYHGIRLSEEVDMQEWQKAACVSFLPPSILDRHGDETCLRIRRVNNGHGRFYFRVQSADRWSRFDLAEMSESPIEESISRELPPPEEPDTPALVKEVKTRVQITLKKHTRNVRGQTGNFVVYQVKAADLKHMFEPLLNTYPKVRGARQIVRVQFTEYRISGGNYRKECGANLNLHNAEVATIVSHIHDVIKRHKWDYTSTVGERKNGVGGILIAQEVAKSPAAISHEFYDREIYGGRWCLCRIKDGKSLVLRASKEVDSIILERSKHTDFTYIVNPKGGILMLERQVD